MKILHITPHYEPAWHLGGVVRSVSQLCRGLAALGLEVTVFTTDSGKDRRMEVPVNRPVDLGGVEVHYFKSDISLKYSYSRALRAACHRNIKDFNLVHLTSFWNYPEIPAWREAKRHSVPYIVSSRGTLLKYPMSQKALKKWVYFHLVEKAVIQGARGIHYTAEHEREGMNHLRPGSPGFVVPNGLNLEEFQHLPPPSEARCILGFNPDARIILYLGRLHARKGLSLLLRAFSRMAHSKSQILLVLAGPDEGEEDNLKKEAEKSGVASRVLFPGYITPDKRNLYLRAADLCALVTHPGENFGNAAVEAMLAGVPVLVSEHVGICREVEADGAGAVVPLEVEAIAGALQRMLSDAGGLRQMGRRAAESARRRYDIQVVAQMMAAAYADILTGRRSPELNWSDE
jgi:glycosyltransferase involved in cell wall biosynthesis